MIATIIPNKKKHYSVLLDEIISIITPQYGGTFIDCTFGQGGYTKKILEFPKTQSPIYSFCGDFFQYIGLWVCDDFGVADSFTKLGPWFENLSELVPKPRGGLNPFE